MIATTIGNQRGDDTRHHPNKKNHHRIRDGHLHAREMRAHVTEMRALHDQKDRHNGTTQECQAKASTQNSCHGKQFDARKTYRINLYTFGKRAKMHPSNNKARG